MSVKNEEPTTQIESMMTAEQLRAGRSMLNWSARELAERAGVGITTIQRIENGKITPENLTIQVHNKIMGCLRDHGVTFGREFVYINTQGPCNILSVQLIKRTDGEVFDPTSGADPYNV